jgi:ferritin-like metal-binding protein YciE
MTFTSDAAIDTYISGLKNAHALEKQALQLMERQVERIESYPEVGQLLRTHIRETEQQVQRIDEILHTFGEDRSILKDMATQISGNLAAIAHSVMPDEILKNHFANHAFENFEIASYESLIAMAEATGHHGHVTALRTSLGEEEKTARLLREMTPQLTLKYMRLYEESTMKAKV